MKLCCRRLGGDDELLSETAVSITNGLITFSYENMSGGTAVSHYKLINRDIQINFMPFLGHQAYNVP